MSNLDPTVVIKYRTEFSDVFQTEGSMLRGQVWTDSAVVGNQVRFPLLAEATSEVPVVGQPITFDADQPHTNVTVDLGPLRSARLIDDLQRFNTNIDYRAGYSRSCTNELGRKMDVKILAAMAASNTSLGATAALDMARVAKVTAGTTKYKWPRGKKTWVITPSVYEKLMGIQQYGSADYNNKKPLVDGTPNSFMGWDIVVLPELETSTYWNSSTDHNTYAFHQNAVGLGISADIGPHTGFREDLQAWQVVVQGVFGAKTIQATGVLKVAVNGL